MGEVWVGSQHLSAFKGKRNGETPALLFTIYFLKHTSLPKPCILLRASSNSTSLRHFTWNQVFPKTNMKANRMLLTSREPRGSWCLFKPLPSSRELRHSAGSWEAGGVAAREAAGQDLGVPSLPGASGMLGRVQLYIPGACDLTIGHAQGRYVTIWWCVTPAWRKTRQHIPRTWLQLG